MGRAEGSLRAGDQAKEILGQGSLGFHRSLQVSPLSIMPRFLFSAFPFDSSSPGHIFPIPFPLIVCFSSLLSCLSFPVLPSLLPCAPQMQKAIEGHTKSGVQLRPSCQLPEYNFHSEEHRGPASPAEGWSLPEDGVGAIGGRGHDPCLPETPVPSPSLSAPPRLQPQHESARGAGAGGGAGSRGGAGRYPSGPQSALHG